MNGRKIEILNTDETYVKEARDNEKLRENYISLMKDDYIYYMINNEKHHFIKRDLLHTIWKDVLNGYIKHDDGIYYTENNPEQIDNVVVVFQGCAVSAAFDTSSIKMRYLVENFKTIDKYISPNTKVYHILDVNLHMGSFYKNTTNYPDYEENISEFLNKVCIQGKKVIFYGASKGGTAATNYGIKHNVNFVAVDPITNLVNADINRKEFYFLDDVKDRLINISSSLRSDYTAKGTFIISEQVPKNYENVMLNFPEDKFKKINVKNEKIKSHGDIGPNSIHILLMIINQILEEDSWIN